MDIPPIHPSPPILGANGQHKKNTLEWNKVWNCGLSTSLHNHNWLNAVKHLCRQGTFVPFNMFLNLKTCFLTDHSLYYLDFPVEGIIAVWNQRICLGTHLKITQDRESSHHHTDTHASLSDCTQAVWEVVRQCATHNACIWWQAIDEFPSASLIKKPNFLLDNGGEERFAQVSHNLFSCEKIVTLA